MLSQRILTALALLALVLPATFYPQPWTFTALALLLIAAAAWEWGRLSGFAQSASLALSGLCALACAATWALGGGEIGVRGVITVPPTVWLIGGALWVLCGAALLRLGVASWPRIPRLLRVGAGLLALYLAWLAVVQARALGVNFLLSVLSLVWVADIAAYFAGRRFGQRVVRQKLAPSISPGKSWEGVWGGMLGVQILAQAWIWADAHWQFAVPSFYTLLSRQGTALLVLALVFMAAMSVVGDLVESLIKRSSGAKDSSRLLPGHGGVLDRIDALLPTLPLALMLTQAIPGMHL